MQPTFLSHTYKRDNFSHIDGKQEGQLSQTDRSSADAGVLMKQMSVLSLLRCIESRLDKQFGQLFNPGVGK